MRQFARCFFLAVFCVALLPAFAFAQTVTGNIAGHITDPAGAAVPGAQITMRHTSTGIERSSESNAAGFYLLSFLPLGTYNVTARAAGFAITTREAVEITLNKTTTVDFALRVSAVQESVTVSETAPLIDLSSGQIRRSIDETLISALPSAGRSFLGFAPLLPGFQTNPTSGQNNFVLSSGSSVSFNGTGTRGATFLTDGVANDDASENQHRQGVNISTVKEMQILTDNYAPEFGRGFGAVVLVQTKSGDNTLHGEAYWLTTNSALNARSFFANAAGHRIDPATGRQVPSVAKASSKTHRLGGTGGGPIVRDRLFYFGSIDRFWAPGAVSRTSYLLPPEWRTPRVDNNAPDAAARRAWVQSIIDRFPANATPNNLPVSPYAYTIPVGRSRHDHDYTGRVDWRKGDRDLFYGRYQYSNFFAGDTEEIVKGEQTISDHAFQNVGLTHTHVFSPRTTGEFRFGFGRRRILVDFLSAEENIPIVRWSFTGFSPIIGNASSFPQRRFQNDFQYVYNLTSNLGSRHTLKFGADIRRMQLNDRAENFNRGFWTFGSAGAFSAMDNFLRGVVTTFQKGYGPPYIGLRMTELNFYGQDDIRLTRSLVLNLGFRFEHVSEPGEVNNLVPPDFPADTYIEPRFGFAWSPSFNGGQRAGYPSRLLKALTGGAGNTVVRGGFGMFHGRVYQSIFSQIGASSRFNPPNAATLTFTNPEQSVADPTGGFVFVPGPPRAQVGLTTVTPDLHMPYTEQWNLTVERQLSWNAALQTSYVGNRGIGFLFYNWQNRAQFPWTSTQPAAYGGAPQGNFPGVTFDRIDANLFNTNPAPGFISLSQARNNARRRDGRYGAILRVSNDAWSYYNALQVSYVQRATKGLSTHVGYTWSSNIDTGSEATFVGGGDINAAVSETQGSRSLRGPSRLSQPHRFVASFAWDLPFFTGQRGLFGRVLGGWQVSGVTTFASGNPFTVFQGYDLNGDAIGGDRPFVRNASILSRSVDNGRVNPATGRKFSQDQLPIAAFFPTPEVAASRQWPWFPGTGIVGDLGRNTFRRHGQNNWDVAFTKNIRLFGERHHLQFRAEMFNFLNRVQFEMPAFLSVVDTGVAGWRLQPRFGEIISQANSPRNMQMTLRYQF